MIYASGTAAKVNGMNKVELIPERRSDGTIVLRAVELGLAERLRRFLRRVLTPA